jgi:3-deoxy-D-manno-octulosonic-acid transferase/heptosyltransferase-1
MRPFEILIVKLSAIGDVVHTLPALNALRRHYPQARISWLVEEAAAGLLEGHRALDQILVSRRKSWVKGLGTPQRRRHLRELLAFVRRLRSQRYDVVLDFQASLKGAALIALVRGSRKIGFDRGLEHQEFSYWVLNERIPAVSMEIHALDRGLLLLRKLGIKCETVEYRLPITRAHHECADRLLSVYGLPTQRGFVAVNPMAKWETKLWDQEKFALVADRLQSRYQLAVVFTGGLEDRPYIASIMARMTTAAINSAGRTDLLTLAALLQRAELMITTDTGPMHIAAAVGTPTVALFGPTAPWRTGPYGQGHRVVRSRSACSPCFKRSCPYAVTCMAQISVDQVLSAASGLLFATASSAGE